ncbi:P1 family peptidase [Rhodospirillaceae bacterium KN72]|uniref:P1 family peptidase n=1 Tax=Pacificispira spongiicola TaxID=2729598 RepID=A0A7Y0E0Q1_9PROT|nr:P1 family peptidase [Pacificispira spongiicola]NMM45085.1 P1 family peptidase [Pacificispira spongiicola]
MTVPKPGTRNSLTDVAGLVVGNAEDRQVRSGTTVILCEPDLRAVAAVQVRGGGPGTRETDALAPGGLVGSVDAVVLSGGSAYGLDAAGGVHAWLGSQGRGYDVGKQRVPIVPSAILYDLSHGGDKDWGEEPPYRRLGREAALAAGPDFTLGKAGAGYGARAGSLEGGLGSASAVDPVTGATVAAIVAVNSFGETTGEDGFFFAAPFERDGEFGGLGPSPNLANPEPVFAKLDSGIAAGRTNTTIAVVATDARLDHADTHRMAVMAEAGFARAIRPIFTPYDGDTVFALSTGRGPAVDLVGLCRLGAIAADCLARAIARGVYEATGTTDWPVWRDRHATAR